MHIWNNILNTTYLRDFPEYIRVQKLSIDCAWENLMTEEWIEIYSAMFDEVESFPHLSIDLARIKIDVPRTFGAFQQCFIFPESATFSLFKSHFILDLEKVLLALNRHHKYYQGMNIIAASFLLGGRSAKMTFVVMSFLLNQRHLSVLFEPNCSSLDEYLKIFEKRFRKTNKKLYKHFKASSFPPICYAIEWFTTFFTLSCPGELSNCVVDMLLVGFNDIMIRVGLAVMDILGDELLLMDQEALMANFRTLVRNLNPAKLILHSLLHVVRPEVNILEVICFIYLAMVSLTVSPPSLRFFSYRSCRRTSIV